MGKVGIEIKDTKERSNLISTSTESKLSAVSEKYNRDVTFLKTALNEEQLARKRA